jgi:[protein-PII] uridylyltransferase
VVVKGGDDGRVVVVAPDRPGLFCQLSGLFAIQGLDVLAADLRSWAPDHGGPDVAVDVFRVEPTHGDEYDWERFETNLASVLDGRLALEARLAQRAQAYKTASRRRAGEQITPEVTVHNDASEDASVVEVRAHNATGVLYRIARAFLELQLDVRHAKVHTLGDEVVDSFYVVDRHGKKVTGEDQLGELRRAVLFELSRLEL